MIRDAISFGKAVTVPVTDMNERRLIPSFLQSFEDDLAPGAMGIPEPRKGKIRQVPPEEIDVVITPGAAFCEEGWRVGYGGGFYDRFLRNSKKKALALAFELQIVQEVPHDLQYDVGVDCIVTENRVIYCKA